MTVILATEQPTPQQLVDAANAKIIELCKRAFDKGVNEGYARGFQHGVNAANGVRIEPSEALFNKPV